MVTCTKCHGERYVEWEEDGRMVRDACYHCGTTGVIDEETLFHDNLASVATALAVDEEQEYRAARDSDPEGEDYAFCAAENMMSAHDYFTVRVWDREARILEKLLNLPLADKELLIAWNKEPAVKSAYAPKPPPKPERAPRYVPPADDDIPF